MLDPFCGSGTTALAAVQRGHDATTIDINPLLAWLARAKTARYAAGALGEAAREGRRAARAARLGGPPEAADPPMRNIGRWWPDRARLFLRRLKPAIRDAPVGSARAADLLSVAFCRTLIGLSSASFGHQSMSFKGGNESQSLPAMERAFLGDLDAVIGISGEDIPGSARVICGDSRDMGPCASPGFDVVVTSPPYANRMSYIREMRPYMYWLDYLTDGRDAGELDWDAIGGTWGGGGCHQQAVSMAAYGSGLAAARPAARNRVGAGRRRKERRGPCRVHREVLWRRLNAPCQPAWGAEAQRERALHRGQL